MKIITEQSLANFEFWEGGKDTADKLTLKQLERVEDILEVEYPEGMTRTELNDKFRYDSDYIFQIAGVYPKYYTITADCGLDKYVKAEDEEDVDFIENSGISYYEEGTVICKTIYESLYDIDIDDFKNTRFLKIHSRVGNNEMVMYAGGNEVEKMKAAFEPCEIEEISSVPGNGLDDAEDWEDWYRDKRAIDEFIYNEDEMFDYFDIPVYAIPRICKLILDPDDTLDYYEIPESTAINNYNYCLELDEEDVKNIDEFVADLRKAIPEGFTIDWDAVSVGSPYFEPYPAFGKAMDCVKLRVYPNNKNTED